MNFLSNRTIVYIIITAIFICVGQIIGLTLKLRSCQKDIAVKNIIIQHLLAQSYQHSTKSIEINNNNIQMNQADVDSLITIHNKNDIIIKRNELIHFIWGKPSIPSSTPAVIQKNIQDERYQSLKDLKTIHRLTVEMDYGLESIIYLFMPLRSTKTLVLYHQGHRGDFILGYDFIQYMLSKGYSVAAFAMPLLGMNNQPVVFLSRLGKFKISDHEHLKLLQPQKGHPIQFFLTPVIEMINTADIFGFKNIAMTGISGGGWTCTIAASLDRRITRSYPVAGTLPIFLRSEAPNNWGDYEQTIPDFYRIANYLELYIMGAYGDNRKQIQILNLNDPCCFNGNGYQCYLQVVKDRMKTLKRGSFDLFSDPKNKTHSISKESLDIISKDIHDAFDSKLSPQ